MNNVLTRTAKRAYQSVLTRLPIKARRRIMYYRVAKRPLRLKNPKLFTEKVNWRILNDRRPILQGTCDKTWMQDYAIEAGCKVPKRLWSGTDINEMANLNIEGRWVLKPNHSSGRLRFGEGRPNPPEFRELVKGWLDTQTSVTLNDEWAYGEAKKCYILEERLGGPGDNLDDYKFFVFGGFPELVQVDSSRFTAHQRRLYTTDWEPLDVKNVYPLGPAQPKPETFDQMLAMAAKLGAPFDFIRVDFYEFNGEMYFGELTPYPGGGIEPYVPSDLDATLGRKWKLPTL